MAALPTFWEYTLSFQDTAYTVGALIIFRAHLLSLGSTLYPGSTIYILEHCLTSVSIASHSDPHRGRIWYLMKTSDARDSAPILASDIRVEAEHDNYLQNQTGVLKCFAG